MESIVLNGFQKRMFVIGLVDYIECNLAMIEEMGEEKEMLIREGVEGKEIELLNNNINDLVEGLIYYNNLKLEIESVKLNEDYVLIRDNELKECVIEYVMGECEDFLEELNWLDK